MNSKEINIGYVIKRSILFENGYGFALGENLNAPDPYVTWRFSEKQGHRDYYLGRYTSTEEKATKDFEERVSYYQEQHKYVQIIEPKSIAERMKEGAEKAAEHNAARTEPPKKKEQDLSD